MNACGLCALEQTGGCLCPKVHLEPAETDLSDTESSQQRDVSPRRALCLLLVSLCVCPGDDADGAALRRTPESICFFREDLNPRSVSTSTPHMKLNGPHL